MDFNDTTQEAEFRKEVFSWLSANAELKDGSKDSLPAMSEEDALVRAKEW